MESFNYHYDRHQDLNTQVLDRNLESQKEKLETDLKREIKKLQKNREQIKNWQLNDNVEVVVTRNKLQDYRKLVEEAMEKYKEVEKSSKMKSFSNQSIMLASLEDSQYLSKSAIEVLNFLEESIEELSLQIETLEADYERFSSKKPKKNSSVESELQELENFINNDKFHLENFENIVEYIKNNQIDPDLVLKIKEDITFYLESNQEPDFINDDTLYDEVVLQAESTYKYVPESNGSSLEETLEVTANSSGNGSNGVDVNGSTPSKSETKKERLKSPSPSTPTKKSNDFVVTPIKNRVLTPDIDIVQKLKPAATPSRVTGEVAWSSVAGVAAAVAGASSTVDSGKSNSSNEKKVEPSIENGNHPSVVKPETRRSLPNDNYTPFYQVLEKSNLANVELELFTDSNLMRLPPGIQSLIMSFNATRRIKGAESDNSSGLVEGKLLFNSSITNSLGNAIIKPYLPKSVQTSSFCFNQEIIGASIKHPLRLTRYGNQWNELRQHETFDLLVTETKSLIQEQPTALEAINELFMIFFYGFYYGMTPLENLVAESKLFALGWRPYAIKSINPTQPIPTNEGINSDKYFYWIRNIKGVSEPEEFGDFQVFDLSTWDIHLKVAFRLDNLLADPNPLRTVA